MVELSYIMLTFLDVVMISVSKQMVFCLGLVFVILLYKLDCYLITVPVWLCFVVT